MASAAFGEAIARSHPTSPAFGRLTLLAERLSRTIAVARGLTAAHRVVDLAGFEDGVGLLCAKALDLEAAESRHLVPALLELRAQIDGLSLTIAAIRSPPATTRREAH